MVSFVHPQKPVRIFIPIHGWDPPDLAHSMEGAVIAQCGRDFFINIHWFVIVLGGVVDLRVPLFLDGQWGFVTFI